ncbi:MAG: hypothetical protein Q7T80_07690 [Methanoregula sp.]|nr:hypothetical protein [Methanoregula sp.]
MKKHILLGCILLLFLLCGFANAIMVSQNLSELTLGSDAIVYGKIVDVKSQWNADKTHIETTAQILVNDVFASSDKSVSPGNTISVTVRGGAVGNDTEWVEDTPVFIPNVDVIVFLKKTSTGKYALYGLTQGLIPVINGQIGDSKTGTMQAPGNDINSFKQDINAILQGNVGTKATEKIPTTQQAPMLFAPVITAIAAVLIFRKNEQ